MLPHTEVSGGLQAIRDPRFDNASGSFEPSTFSTAYSFLATNRKEELAELRKRTKAARKNASMSNRDKEALERELTRMESIVAREEKERQEKETLKAWKKEEFEKRKEGKGAFHLKRGTSRCAFRTVGCRC